MPAATDDDVDRLLLAFEELASNGLGHGEAPVQVVVTIAAAGWLLVVSDAAVDRPPRTAVGRDAATGGLGLYRVARMAAAHGWVVHAGRKHVRARIDVSAARPQQDGGAHLQPRSGAPSLDRQ